MTDRCRQNKRPVLKYPGSKWKMADWIISLMPPHKSYLEPFFGSGAVFFRKPPSRIETINDLDGEIVNLFRFIREKPKELACAVALTPYSREECERAAAEGASLKISDLEEKLEALKNAPVEVAIQAADPEEVQRAVEEALRKAKEEHKAELDAMAEKAKKADAERDRLKKKLEKMKYDAETAGDGEAQREVERLKKELAMADPVVAEFKGLFEQASGLVAKLLGLVDCAPEDKKKNLRDAMAALGRQLEVQG